jgi:hypothetical protein
MLAAQQLVKKNEALMTQIQSLRSRLQTVMTKSDSPEQRKEPSLIERELQRTSLPANQKQEAISMTVKKHPNNNRKLLNITNHQQGTPTIDHVLSGFENR